MIGGRDNTNVQKRKYPESLCGRRRGRRKPFQRVGRTHELAAAVGAQLDFDLALGEPLRPNQDLKRNADQVGGGELCARPLVEIVVEHLDPALAQRRVELFASRIRLGPTLLEVEES